MCFLCLIAKVIFTQNIKRRLMGELREDNLLIGEYKVLQDPDAYCFTSDSVRLSKFVKCKNSDRVLELCAGCGIISLHKFAENEYNGDTGRGRFYLVEIQKVLFDLLEKNIKLNSLEDVFVSINDDLKNTFQYVDKTTFDVVICNPPYEKVDAGFEKKGESKKIARAEIMTNFDEIAKIASGALRFGGAFYFLCKSERLFEIASALHKNSFAIKKVEFISARNRFRLAMVKAVKGGNEGVEFGVYKD